MKPKRHTSTRPVSSVALGSIIRHAGRDILLTADLRGGRMGRVVVRGKAGELDDATWMAPDTEVEVVRAYEPARTNNDNTNTDPLVSGQRE